uniref:Uncharacterized protein n=1 Tax=Heterorhabditis bacteriophora TaxID=37862 RepID=A0A1I7XT12_HETBA
MQDHESEMESIMERKRKEVMFPPNNPYAVDSGGRLKNLRETCTIDRVGICLLISFTQIVNYSVFRRFSVVFINNYLVHRFMDKTVREHVDENSWDMERMGFLIDQNIMNELVKLETDAHNEIFGHMIGHQLFGNDNDESLKDRINEVCLYMENWSYNYKTDHFLILDNSNSYLYDELVLEKFHEKVAAECDRNPDLIVQKLEELRNVLFSCGLNAHFICNIDLIDSKLYGPEQWQFTLEGFGNSKKFQMNIVSSKQVDESDFEAAKRSLVFELMQKEGTVSSAGKLSILGVLRNTPTDYNNISALCREICQRIWNTSSDDMMRIGGPRVANLFENFTRAIAVHPSKVTEIKRAFPGIECATVASLNYKMGSL